MVCPKGRGQRVLLPVRAHCAQPDLDSGGHGVHASCAVFSVYGGGQHGVESVSYTHLKVYGFQGISPKTFAENGAAGSRDLGISFDAVWDAISAQQPDSVYVLLGANTLEMCIRDSTCLCSSCVPLA